MQMRRTSGTAYTDSAARAPVSRDPGCERGHTVRARRRAGAAVRCLRGDRPWGGAAAAFATLLVFSGCGGTQDRAAGPAPPADLVAGQAAFEATCVQCHGAGAQGTSGGPPLVDPVYKPSHHGDFAFTLAVRRGVPAHHWGFGDMPPQPGVSETELVDIVGYVRRLQRRAGID